jgi:DNA invertase Pin-like site-specific DNA recombinase
MKVENHMDARGREELGHTAFSRAAEHERTAVIGYASCSSEGSAGTAELKLQASVIARECSRRGLALIEVVAEREPDTGKGLGRPGLAYALDRIRSGEAKALMVSELSRMTHSAAELGSIVEWLLSQDVRLIAPANSLDTESEHGRIGAQLIIEVSRWERRRLSERTRKGLEAARSRGKTTGRSAVSDNPDLTERINQMRAQGMTLQAIADRLNEEGVPTVRGGTKWRHSSVQAAAGYKRRTDRLPRPTLLEQALSGEDASGTELSLAEPQRVRLDLN